MKGHEIIKNLVKEEMPDIEKVRAHCHEQFAYQNERGRNTMRIQRIIPIAAAMATILAISTTVFAALGGFDLFAERFNPHFVDVVEPVMEHSENQGINMTVIGAQRYDNMAVIYLSLQDTTGANCITESVGFGDGFWIEMENAGNSNGMNVNVPNLLYFDKTTNTAYLELRITADTAISDPLTVNSFLLVFGADDYEHEPIPFSFADISTAEMISVTREEVFGASYWTTNDVPTPNEILRPGYLTAMPHAHDYWISNMGIVDGRLHLQAIKGTGEFGSGEVSFSLISPDGDTVYPAFLHHIWLDENLSPVELGPYLDTYEQLPPYSLSESVFDDADISRLADYTLVFSGRVTSGVEGNWQVTAYTADTANHIIAFTNDIWTDDYLFEFITINPLGMRALGTVTIADSLIPGEIFIETADALVPLRGGGESSELALSFNQNWQAESPLDVNSVKAVIINGTRIPIT